MKTKFKELALIMAMLVIGTSGCTIINIEENKDEEISANNPPIEEKVDLVKEKLDTMTLEEKIGQLFMVSVEGETPDENITKLIQQYKVGGIILFSNNIKTSEQTRALLNNLKELNVNNPLNLFLSVDEEGGVVSRFPKDISNFESAWKVGQKNDVNYAKDHGRKIGDTIRELGFNMDMAPVLDVNSNPKNPVIGSRAFSDDPQVVKNMGVQVYKGLEDAGIIAVGKHFPGHGDTSEDSHTGLPIVNNSIDRLRNLELIPFQYAIDNGIEVILTSHILLPKIDEENVATVSSKIITDILRKEMNFKGVVITDDMAMKGVRVNNTIEEGSVKAILAGCDIVLICHSAEDQDKGINAVLNAVKTGIISEERINDSVYRIINLKQKYLR